MQEMTEDAVGLLSFSYSSAAAEMVMALAHSAHPVVMAVAVLLSGLYLSCAAVVAIVFSKAFLTTFCLP